MRRPAMALVMLISQPALSRASPEDSIQMHSFEISVGAASRIGEECSHYTCLYVCTYTVCVSVYPCGPAPAYAIAAAAA